jgi:hypothetical protein
MNNVTYNNTLFNEETQLKDYWLQSNNGICFKKVTNNVHQRWVEWQLFKVDVISLVHSCQSIRATNSQNKVFGENQFMYRVIALNLFRSQTGPARVFVINSIGSFRFSFVSPISLERFDSLYFFYAWNDEQFLVGAVRGENAPSALVHATDFNFVWLVQSWILDCCEGVCTLLWRPEKRYLF